LIDDTKARKIADNLGLKLSDTIGALIKAEKLGFIVSASAKVKELKEKAFFVYDNLLRDLSKLEIE